MKAYKNWHKCVLFVLFTIGILAILRVFGDPINMTATEWFIQVVCSLAVGAVSFYAMYKLMRKWEQPKEDKQ